MDLRNSNGINTKTFKELLLYNRKEVFSKIFIRSGKMHHVELNSGTSKAST